MGAFDPQWIPTSNGFGVVSVHGADQPTGGVFHRLMDARR
jgi:hypothetical protein